MPALPRSLAILGAGPVGLDAALAAAEAGIPFTVYERAARVAGNLREWGHVRLFSPWRMDVSPRMRRALLAAGHEVPDDETCPTGDELVSRVIDPVAALPAIAPHLRLGTRVLGVGREGLLKHEEIASPARARRPFRVLVEDARGERVEHADAVLDCTGVWGNPNALGDGGIPAPGERAAAARIEHRIPDLAHEREAFRGRRVLVVGGGHSAQTAVQALAALAAEDATTEVTWALRRDRPFRSVEPGSEDPLAGRAALEGESARLAAEGGRGVRALRAVAVDAFEPVNGHLRVTLRGADGAVAVEADRVLALTGGVGDHLLYRQLQVHECYATCGPMQLSAALLGSAGGDCLGAASHGAEVLRNPEPGFFLVGAKSYGRNNTFLLRVGWQQVDEVMGLLAR